jgi:hypothetical protein
VKQAAVASPVGRALFRCASWLALHLAIALPAQAQQATPLPPCPKAIEVSQAHMLGLWRAQFESLARGATVLFEKHPDDEGRLTGAINRDGERAQLAGEVHKGEFTMEESADGTRISAAWTGEVVEASCGREIRGTWQEEKDPPRPHPFVLRKQGSW